MSAMIIMEAVKNIAQTLRAHSTVVVPLMRSCLRMENLASVSVCGRREVF